MAQGWLNMRCSARKTSPMPPAPSGLMRRYWPICLASKTSRRSVLIKCVPYTDAAAAISSTSVLDDAHDRHRAADLRIRRRHADEQEHRGERHGADHDRRAPPRVRDEHAVRENEQQPKGKGRWQDAAAGMFQGRPVLEQHKKCS